MWLQSFRFSMQVLRKNRFKILLPAFIFSLFMVLFYSVVMYEFLVYVSISTPEGFDVFAPIILFLLVVSVTFILYSTVYPLLRNYTLFVGWKTLRNENNYTYHDFRSIWKKEGVGKKLRSFTMKRFGWQTLSFLLLCIIPVLLLISHWSIYTPRIPYFLYTYILLHVLTIASFIPCIVGYKRYFFSEVTLIHSVMKPTQEDKLVQLDEKKKTSVTLSSIILWKVALTIVYLLGVFLLVALLLHVLFGSIANYPFLATVTDAVTNRFFEFLFFGSKILFVPMLFIPFFYQGPPVYNGPVFGLQWAEIFSFQGFPYQLLFILLLGLFTAFVFLIETLSTVYYYKQIHLHETK